MLATLAPRAYRKGAVEAIVALQVLFDLLDGLTEQPLQDPLGDGERLFAPFARGAGSQPPGHFVRRPAIRTATCGSSHVLRAAPSRGSRLAAR